MGSWILTRALWFLVIIHWRNLVEIVAFGLRVGTLSKLDRSEGPRWVYVGAYSLILLDLMVGLIKLSLDWLVGLSPVLGPAVQLMELALAVPKTVALIACLVCSRKHAMLLVAGLGILLDVGTCVGLWWSGLTSADMPQLSALAWGVIYFGVSRSVQQVHDSKVALGEPPLWVQFEQARRMSHGVREGEVMR